MTVPTLTPTPRGRTGSRAPALPGTAGDPEPDPAVVLAAYARQVDELARLVEDWQTACAGYARVLGGALGELHVVLDETATELTRRTDRP